MEPSMILGELKRLQFQLASSNQNLATIEKQVEIIRRNNEMISKNLTKLLPVLPTVFPPSNSRTRKNGKANALNILALAASRIERIENGNGNGNGNGSSKLTKKHILSIEDGEGKKLSTFDLDLRSLETFTLDTMRKKIMESGVLSSNFAIGKDWKMGFRQKGGKVHLVPRIEEKTTSLQGIGDSIIIIPLLQAVPVKRRKSSGENDCQLGKPPAKRQKSLFSSEKNPFSSIPFSKLFPASILGG